MSIRRIAIVRQRFNPAGGAERLSVAPSTRLLAMAVLPLRSWHAVGREKVAVIV